MCGIAGIVNASGDAARGALRRMNDAMVHRGPDDCGEFACAFGESELLLGHRRLSIIDTSSCGHQPMIHPGSGDALVFNGEIYNFAVLREELEAMGERFVGHSDTEVLLHALTCWGPDCIRRLNGIFAFAFFNKNRGELILARDPAGVKPLYVAEAAGRLLFASEVRALIASGLVPRSVDRRGLATFFAFGALQRPYTLFDHITEFAPGSHEVWRPGNKRVATHYWNFPRVDPRISFDDAKQGLRERLTEAVRDQLVADVPVGVFLSSGIDSTVIAALAASQRENVQAFTVGFSDQPDMSEQDVAAESAKALGLHHTSINVSGDDTLLAAQRWLQSLDQPSIDGFNVFIISSAIRQCGIKVALAGNGGDELFGGYTSFVDIPLMLHMMRYVDWLGPHIRSALGYAGLSLIGRPQTVREKGFDVAAVGSDLLGIYLQRRRVMSSFQLKALGLSSAPGLTRDYIPDAAFKELALDPTDTTWDLSVLESSFYQPNMLLRDADANGMAHGLEIRVPMLDQRLLDFIHTVPGAVRLPPGAPLKYLLRSTFRPFLGGQTLSQKKVGFVLPLKRWMLGPLRELCEQSLSYLKSIELLQPKGIDRVWNAFLREPESAMWSRAMALCVLGTYAQKAGLR